MNTPDISIIVPLYNGEQWIGRAIESVLLQKGVSWELCIIDDASTDNSARIAKKYTTYDTRIRLSPNVHEKGLSGACNTGIEQVTGTYFILLDCDDALLPGALASLVQLFKKTGAPLVRGRMRTFNDLNYKASAHKYAPSANSTYTLHDASRMPDQGRSHAYATDFIRQHALRYDVDLESGEDTFFHYKAYSLVQHIPMMDTAHYIYLFNHKTISYTPNYIISLGKSLERTLDFLRSKNSASRAEPYAPYFLEKWLQHIYVIQKQPQKLFTEFLQRGMRIIANPCWNIMPAIETIFGQDSERFYALCTQGQESELLHFIEKKGHISPPPAYDGYAQEIKPLQKLMKFLPRKIWYMMHSPLSLHTVIYLACLRWKAYKRRKFVFFSCFLPKKNLAAK